ncbi:MAG: helix-turn-helix transcriptional regulator [Spirochaetaceae bacterium]|nr:helix-turn-helix transcriptional regulator [Spirochaetaceae bacterium]
MQDTDSDITGVSRRIGRSVISQDRLAQHLGYEPSTLSRWLAGQRKPPADFGRRVLGALELLEGAETAANAARQQFLQAAEIAHRNLLAVQAAEHRPQPHELRRGCNEAPAAWTNGVPA